MNLCSVLDLTGGLGVAGSNPVAPTNSISNDFNTLRGTMEKGVPKTTHPKPTHRLSYAGSYGHSYVLRRHSDY
jgi:hypothetical protein